MLVTQLVLTLTIGLALSCAAISLVLLVSGQSESGEWVLFVLAVGVVLPCALAAAALIVRAFDRHGVVPALTPLTALAAAALLGLLIGARLSYAANGTTAMGTPAFALALAAWAAASLSAGRALLSGRLDLGRLPNALAGTRAWAVPGALVAILMVGFPPRRLLDAPELLPALGIACVGFLAYRLLLGARLPRAVGVTVDAGAVLLLFLVLNDLWIFHDPDDFYAIRSNLHQNFYLGPVNDVLGGRPILVDTFSQYGAGLFLFLAGWFQLVPLGYGGMTLLSGLLTAAQAALAYGLLRVAGASRALAVLAVAVIALALAFNPELPPPTSHPSTGGLRFALPYLFLLGAVLAVRDRPGRLRRALPLALLGIASLWSIETFVYTAAAFAGTVVLRAGLAQGPVTARARVLLNEVLLGAGACAAAHVGFAGLVLALTGELPNWGWYLDFIGAYSLEGLGQLVIEPWSPGIALCAVYLASAAGCALIAGRAPGFARQEAVALTAIAGATLLGLASFTYFLGRSYSATAFLAGVPAYLVLGLWLTLLERHRRRVPSAVWIVAPALPFLAAGLAAVFAWPAVQQQMPRTPLALLLPDGGDGGSFRHELGRMLSSDQLLPAGQAVQAAEARLLLRRHFPGGQPAPVLLTSEPTTEVLVYERRLNLLPVSHLLQDSLLMERSWPRVRDAIARLRPGALLLTEPEAFNPQPRFPVPLMERAAAAILRRFELEPIAGRPGGTGVVRLRARR